MTITEFSELDPDSFHLVGEGATGFGVLLAKAKGEVEAVLDETGDLTKARWQGFCGWEPCSFCKDRFGTMHESLITKSRLKTKERNALPRSAFALPDSREYPIHDENHARAALSMLHNASKDQQSKIKAAVHRRYPEIGDDVTAKKEGTPQSAHEDGSLPSGDKGQTSENHPHMGAVHIDVTPDGHHITVPTFSGAPAPTANQEGHGYTAPGKTLPIGEAKTQTAANARKEGGGDGTGDSAPNGESDAEKAEREARVQTEANARKETPGDPAWEAEDVDLAQRAGALIERLESREKAEGSGATKRQISAEHEETIRRAASAVQGFLDSTNATKEIEDMTSEELVKTVGTLLDERDARQATENAAAKAAKKVKADAKAAKVAAKAKKKGKKPPMTDEEVAEKAAADPVWAAKQKAKADVKAAKAAQTGAPDLGELQKGITNIAALVERIASQPQPLPGPLNAAGVAGFGGAAAFTRGAPTGAAPFAIKARKPGETWVPGAVQEELAAVGAIR